MSILCFLICCNVVLGYHCHENGAYKPLNPVYTLGGLEAPRCSLQSCQGRHCSTDTVSSTLSRFGTGHCSCDHNCLIYGDCCYDYFDLCLGVNISNVSDALTNKHFDQQQAGMLNHKQCRPFELGKRTHQFWFVSHCPRNSTVKADDILGCEGNKTSIVARIPVTLLQNPSITFLNFHCAHCHGLKRGDVRFWNTSASCRKDLQIDKPFSYADFHMHIIDGRCKLIISETNDVDPRPCSTVYQSNPTNKTSNPDKERSLMPKALELCALYLYPLLDQENNEYKNAHCAYLNGAIIHLKCSNYERHENKYSGFEKMTSLGSQSMQPTAFPQNAGAKPLVGSFGIMFNFGSNEMTLEVGKQIIKVEKQCPKDDEVYVSYLERCDKVFCPPHMQVLNGTCRIIGKFVEKGTDQMFPNGTEFFVFDVRVHGQKNIVKTQMASFIRKALATFLDTDTFDKGSKISVKSFSHTDIEQQIAEKNMTESTEHSVRLFKTSFKTVLQTRVPVAFIYRKIRRLYGYIWEHARHLNVSVTDASFNNFKTLKSPLNYDIKIYFREFLSGNNNSICENDRFPILFRQVDLKWNGNALYVKANIKYYKLDNVLFQISISNDRPLSNVTNEIALSNVTNIVVCQHFGRKPPVCPQGMHHVDKASFRLVNTSLILYHGEKTMNFSSEKFRLQTNGGAMVCFPIEEIRSELTEAFFQYQGIQDILTIVTTAISMVSLFLSLCVYCALPQLRNTPGKIVMALSGTLFLAQGLQLLLTVPTGWMCVAVASLGHITWLSTFIWMTVLSADLARSLKTMSPLSAVNSSQKLFCMYAVSAWLLPTVFVTGCVLVDRYNVLGIVIGYGTGRICWISNTMANLYIFGIPVALTLIVNCLCFVLTLVNIEKTAANVPSKTFKNEKTRLFIYIRLMLIMGLSWVFAFAAAFAEVEFLWYFQIVCSGLQGLSIFVCFVCKPRIKMLLLTKFCLDPKTITVDEILTSTETAFSTQ